MQLRYLISGSVLASLAYNPANLRPGAQQALPYGQGIGSPCQMQKHCRRSPAPIREARLMDSIFSTKLSIGTSWNNISGSLHIVLVSRPKPP